MMSLRQFAKHLVVVGLTALPMMSNAGALGPVPPKAKANASETTKCVEPIAEMRKNHMTFLKHKRDETMREGVRTKTHSLTECIDCHVTPKKNGEFARIGDNEHFCSSCHNYAAVNVDSLIVIQTYLKMLQIGFVHPAKAILIIKILC